MFGLNCRRAKLRRFVASEENNAARFFSIAFEHSVVIAAKGLMITMPGEKPDRPATGRHYNPTLRVPKALFGFPGNKRVNNVSFQMNVAQPQSRNASAPDTVVVGELYLSLVDEYRTGSGRTGSDLR